MARSKSYRFFARAAGSLFLPLILLPAVGWSEYPSPPPGCPALPEQGSTNTVSVHVAKAVDVPGVVCVRVINRLNEEVVGTAGFMLRLQAWQKNWWWQKGRFVDFRETFPGGVLVGGTAVQLKVPAGGIVDQRLPLGQPAPPGRYRACCRYILPRGGEEREVCSEEFSLP